MRKVFCLLVLTILLGHGCGRTVPAPKRVPSPTDTLYTQEAAMDAMVVPTLTEILSR